MSMAPSLVLADDSALLREGLAGLLERQGYDVIARESSAPGLVDCINRLDGQGRLPDAIITDVRMPPSMRNDGLEAALAIRRRHPAVAIMVLSQYVSATYAQQLFAADAPVDAFLVLALIVVPEPEDESGPVVVEMVPQAVTSAIAARAASAPPVRCARRPRGSAFARRPARRAGRCFSGFSMRVSWCRSSGGRRSAVPESVVMGCVRSVVTRASGPGPREWRSAPARARRAPAVAGRLLRGGLRPRGRRRPGRG